MGDRDDHILVGIEVLRVEFLGRRTDLGSSRVGVFVLQFDGLSLDDLHLLLDASENLVAAGELLKLVIFSLKLLPLQSGQLTEPHLDNGCRLGVGEFEP